MNYDLDDLLRFATRNGLLKSYTISEGRITLYLANITTDAEIMPLEMDPEVAFLWLEVALKACGTAITCPLKVQGLAYCGYCPQHA